MPSDTSDRSRLGVVFLPTDARHAVDLVVRADRAGVGTAWLEMNAIGLDPFPLLAAAGVQTERIGLGTAIVPAFGRHPATLATQVLALEGLAPGRVRLGVGTGNAARMAEAFGHPGDRPLARLREYVAVLRAILHDGGVRFAGDFYTANVTVPEPSGTPVLVSSLGPHAYALAGEVADGALSWLCPPGYLLDVARPAVARGAAGARRSTPLLVAHVPVALETPGGPDGLRDAVRQDLARYARVPVFARMLTAAGYTITDGTVTDDLLDDLVVIGDEASVAARLAGLLEEAFDEVMVSLVPETHDRDTEDKLLAAGTDWPPDPRSDAKRRCRCPPGQAEFVPFGLSIPRGAVFPPARRSGAGYAILMP